MKKLFKYLFSISSKVPPGSYIFTLSGGIGNQLLQYTIGENIRKEFNKNIYYIDLSKTYSNIHNSNIERLLNLKIKTITSREIFKKPVSFLFSPISLRLQSFIFKKTGFKLFNLYFENLNTDMNAFNINELPYPYFYIGLWHNLINKYNFNQIIKAYDFNPIFSIADKLKKLYSQKPIGVHIRRGDYINNKKTSKFHGNLPIEYFLEAVKFIRNIYGDSPVIFFSDDITWVKENIKNLIRKSYVLEDILTAEMDLYLMSKCSYFVLSNSTFSWWAASLSSYESKFIVLPRYWFRGIKVSNLIIPSDWKYKII